MHSQAVILMSAEERGNCLPAQDVVSEPAGIHEVRRAGLIVGHGVGRSPLELIKVSTSVYWSSPKWKNSKLQATEASEFALAHPRLLEWS